MDPCPLEDHPLSPLIDAYIVALAHRVMVATPENIAAQTAALDDLNEALAANKAMLARQPL